MTKIYYIYIITNTYNSVLYTGVTNNLLRRIHEHRQFKGSKFTSKYKVAKLVYFEETGDIKSALSREKQIKGGSRQRKENLIEAFNPDWRDLYDEI